MRSDEGVDAFSGLLLGSEESWISGIFAVTHCSLLQLTVRNPSLDGLRRHLLQHCRLENAG